MSIQKFTIEELKSKFYVDGGVVKNKFPSGMGGRYPAGSTFGCVKSGNSRSGGYVAGTSRGIFLQAHQISWALANGRIQEPNEEVDHIDGNRQNNAPENLRCGSKSMNQQNRKEQKNISGYRGVYFEPKKGLYRVQFRLNKKLRNFGRFKNIEDAIAMYKSKRMELMPNTSKPLADKLGIPYTL